MNLIIAFYMVNIIKWTSHFNSGKVIFLFLLYLSSCFSSTSSGASLGLHVMGIQMGKRMVSGSWQRKTNKEAVSSLLLTTWALFVFIWGTFFLKLHLKTGFHSLQKAGSHSTVFHELSIFISHWILVFFGTDYIISPQFYYLYFCYILCRFLG